VCYKLIWSNIFKYMSSCCTQSTMLTFEKDMCMLETMNFVLLHYTGLVA
jgi:hypothetical protein